MCHLCYTHGYILLARRGVQPDVAGGPYAIVLDNRSAGPVSPTQRAIIAEHMRLHAPRTSARCAGTALVFESPVLRGALTAILWLRPPVTVTKVFGSLDEAITWARERLDARMLGPGSNPHLSAFPGKR